MSRPRSHRSPPRSRTLRTAKVGTAAEAIGTLTPGAELYILTFGQFSLIDALVALLEQTGPADVIVSTWTAAAADLTTSAALLERANLRSLRFLVDRSFIARQPAYCATMRRLFGDECIRTARSHCKFITVRNERWSLAVRTSMNLNFNPRMENLEVSDDPDLCAFLEAVVEEIYQEQDPGTFDADLPELAGVPNVPRPGQIERGIATVGFATSAGRASTGHRTV